MNKPTLDHKHANFPTSVKLWLETICGRRGNKLKALFLNKLSSAGANPTQAEFNALAADVVETRRKLNDLIERLDS